LNLLDEVIELLKRKIIGNRKQYKIAKSYINLWEVDTQNVDVKGKKITGAKSQAFFHILSSLDTIFKHINTVRQYIENPEEVYSLMRMISQLIDSIGFISLSL